LGRARRDASLSEIRVAARKTRQGEHRIAMFSGRGKLLRIGLLFAALVALGIFQWVTDQKKQAMPLAGKIRVLVVPHSSETTSCKDWTVDVYLENNTNERLELYGYTVHTSVGGDEEQTVSMGKMTTKADTPIRRLGKAKSTRIWHADDGCQRWADRGNWRTEPTDVRYRVVAYTSNGIYSAIAGTKVSIQQ
jgi:hypothetical protein